MSSDEASASRCKQQHLKWTGWGSNHMEGETSSRNLFQVEAQNRKGADIKCLKGRLRILEEEAEMLKVVLMESAQERTKLTTELYEQFEILQQCLMQRKQERGERCTGGGQIISYLKNRGAGLLQVLQQESDPWLVERGVKVKQNDPAGVAGKGRFSNH